MPRGRSSPGGKSPPAPVNVGLDCQRRASAKCGDRKISAGDCRAMGSDSAAVCHSHQHPVGAVGLMSAASPAQRGPCLALSPRHCAPPAAGLPRPSPPLRTAFRARPCDARSAPRGTAYTSDDRPAESTIVDGRLQVPGTQQKGSSRTWNLSRGWNFEHCATLLRKIRDHEGR